MSEENQPENEAITTEDLGLNDPVEATGDGTPAEPAGIEAAADAAAAAEPAPEPEPPAAPEPEAPAEPAQDKKAAAAPSKRRRQTAGKRGKDTAASQAHLAAKKAARPEPAPTPEPSDEHVAAQEAKKATRARLREIKAELEALADDRQALIDEQAILVNGPPNDAPEMTFVERHQQVLARSKEVREQRVRDRLKLLAAGAGRSPLDQSLASRPRQSMAAADAKVDADKSE